MTGPMSPRCQSDEIRREERQFLCHDPIITDHFTLMWQFLIRKYIWPVYTSHFNRTTGDR